MFRRRTRLFHPSAQGPLAEGLVETPLLPFVLESATVATATTSSSLSPEAPTASVALPPEASAPVPLSPEVPVPLLGAF